MPNYDTEPDYDDVSCLISDSGPRRPSTAKSRSRCSGTGRASAGNRRPKARSWTPRNRATGLSCATPTFVPSAATRSLPDASQDAATEAADGMVSWNDAEVAAGRTPLEVVQQSLVVLHQIATELAQARRAEPRSHW